MPLRRRLAASAISSWAVITLFLGFGLGTRRWRLVFFLTDLFFVFLHHARDVHHEIARRQVHDLHALRVAAGDADALDRHADHDAFLRDHHELVVGQHFLQGDHVAGLVVALQRDDAPAAAVLDAILVELRALAHALFGDREQRGFAPHDHHVDDRILLVELDPLHAGGRPAHVADVLLVEANAHAVRRGEHDVVLAVGHLHVDQLVALLDVDRANAHRARIAELRQDRLLHNALLGREEQELVLRELAHRHERGDSLVRLHRDARQNGLAARRARGLRDLVDLEPVALALLGEEHHVIVRRGDEQVLDPIVFLLMRGDHAFAAAPLPAVCRHRQPLDVAGVRHGDHHVLFGDQVFDRKLALIGDDLGAPLVPKALRQLGQLFLEDLHPARLGGEDLLALLDELADVLQLLFELRDLERREPREPHVQDFSRLLLRKLEPLAQRRIRRRRVLGLLDDLVDVVDGDLQAFEDVLAILRALELEFGAAGDDGVTVLDEVLQQLEQRQLARRAVHQREHDRAERLLHLRVLVELVQHDHGDGVALQLDDEANSFYIRFVADVADAYELLREHEVADLLVHALGTHLIGKLGDDDLLLAAGLPLLDDGTRPDDDAAAPLLVALLDPLFAVDDRTRREVRAFDELPDVLDGGGRMIDQMHDRLDDLAQIVRRDVGRHAARDAGRAVHQQVRQAPRQDGGLLEPVVEVWDERDGVLVDVLQHRHRDAGETRFGVAIGGRGVAVDRPEVSLPVDQRIAQREVLHHADERVVDRDVAVRMVLAEDVADDGGGFLVRPARHQAELVHRVEDAPVDRLQAVAHIGQRALHDDAHRVIEERLF